MIGGLLTLVIAAVGAAYGGLVIRAAPTRRDNVMFGVLAMTDAAMILWRGVNVLSGESIVSTTVQVPCAIGTIVLALITMDFLTAFPRRPAMAWRWRLLLIAWGVAGAAIVGFAGNTVPSGTPSTAPAIASFAMKFQMARNWRMTRLATCGPLFVVISS